MLLVLGYSINTLTLFGLVLAIGIVVDDAIVVVENVETRDIADGLTPHDANSRHARGQRPDHRDCAGAVRGVHPLTFVPGLSGQFYKQFAATIAISTVISAFNSALSPAMAARCCARMMRPDKVVVVMDRLFGKFFHWFNCMFQRRSAAYGRGVTGCCSASRWRWWCTHPAAADRAAVHTHSERLRAGAGQAVPDRHRPAAGRLLAGPHREGDPANERHRAQGAGHRRLDCLPGPVDCWLLLVAQRGSCSSAGAV
jgi:hypothetical protein